MTSILALKKASTPKELADKLAALGPIWWSNTGNFWVVTKANLAKEVLSSTALSADRRPFFIERMPEVDLALLSDFLPVVANMMVMQDGAQHLARRKICFHGFSYKHIQSMVPKIKQRVQQQIAQLQSEFDFVTDFAEYLPMQMLADFFAIAENDRALFYHHAKIMTAFFGGASAYNNQTAIQANNSAIILRDYFNQLYRERQAKPQADFFSELIQHQDAFGLTQQDIVAQAIMMWVAGMVTTSDQLANNMVVLLQQQIPFSHLLELNEQEWTQVINECTRLDPAVTFTFRVAKEEFKLFDQIIKPQQAVFVATHAVNRDAAVYANADQIDFKHASNSFAYGHSSHFCLGSKLAQIMMRIVLQSIIQQFPRLSLVSYEPNHYSLSFSGMKSVLLALGKP